MTIFEKVVEGLYCCVNNGDCYDCCPYYPVDTTGCRKREMLADALAILKPQEPKVVTLEEVGRFVFGNPYIIETKEPYGETGLMYGLFSHRGLTGNYDFRTMSGRINLLDSDYGVIWRCWTSVPSNERRKAVKWNDSRTDD